MTTDQPRDEPVTVHACGNCEGIDPGSCLMNPDRREPDNETATALARHIASHPVGDVQAAYRLLGMELAFEVRDGTPAPGGDGRAAAVCHYGLGTRQQCATEPWGCAHDREHAPKAPQSGEVAAVRAELDRIAELPTVTSDDGRADRFSTGARWTLRMIREVLTETEPTP